MSDRKDFQTQLGIKKDFYSDVFTNFVIHPNKRDLVLLKEEESIKRSLKNIIFTSRTERFFNNDFGCNINKYLFELMTQDTLISIKQEIESAITNFEPRVNLIDVNVSFNEDYNSVFVGILFSIVNKSEPIQFTLRLERVR